MAKYFLSFILIIYIVLVNNSINNKLYAKSELINIPSSNFHNNRESPGFSNNNNNNNNNNKINSNNNNNKNSNNNNNNIVLKSDNDDNNKIQNHHQLNDNHNNINMKQEKNDYQENLNIHRYHRHHHHHHRRHHHHHHHNTDKNQNSHNNTNNNTTTINNNNNNNHYNHHHSIQNQQLLNQYDKQQKIYINPLDIINRKFIVNSDNSDNNNNNNNNNNNYNIDYYDTNDYLNDDNNINLLNNIPIEIINNNNNNNNNNDYNSDLNNNNKNINSDSSYSISSSISNNNNNNLINNGIKCPKCSSTTNKVRVSEEELTELRIDFVKRQILQKLRLKEKPHVSGINYLPKPITEREYEYSKPKENLDDYYARTSKKFIILERETKECSRFNKNPSICFSFKIDDVDVDSIDVNQAVLWLHKTKNNTKDQMKQTLVVSEIDQQQINLKYLPKVKPIAMTSVGVDEGWIKIDIAWPIRKWVGYHELSHLIHISCESCELDSEDGLISLEKEYQPFIVIDTQFRRQRQRQKRSVNCTAGITECCREKLYISFKEIGWSDWIIQPEGYDAYFCRGSCSSSASIAASTNHHSAFVQKLAQYRESSNGKKPLELIPCCTAKQFSSLQLFYRDSNNTVTLKTLPNMVVESCGCM